MVVADEEAQAPLAERGRAVTLAMATDLERHGLDRHGFLADLPTNDLGVADDPERGDLGEMDRRLRRRFGLGLVGWVKNEPDGGVSAVAEGPRAQVEAFVAWCRRGPPGARVDAVDATWSEPSGKLTDFEVRR